MYAVELDDAGGTIKLVKWVNGTRTEIGSATLTFGLANIVWFGADFSDYLTDAGRLKVYASKIEGNLIQAANLKISAQDEAVGVGGTVGLLSYQVNVRFVNFTAGSPAHAEVADVAKALDGPIIGGQTRWVWYNATTNLFEYADDGSTMTAVGAGDADKVDGQHAAAFATSGHTHTGYVPITSTNRPVVTKLYRNDNDSSYNVQTYWDGTRWVLQGYNGDVYHAPARVAYADAAGSATSASTASALTPGARGTDCYRSGDYTGSNGGWVPTYFNAQYVARQGSGPYWDGSTAIYCVRTGWHFCKASLGVYPNDWPDIVIHIAVNSGATGAWGGVRYNTDRNADQIYFMGVPLYLTAGQYIQLYYYKVTGGNAPTIGRGWTNMAMVEMY